MVMCVAVFASGAVMRALQVGGEVLAAHLEQRATARAERLRQRHLDEVIAVLAWMSCAQVRVSAAGAHCSDCAPTLRMPASGRA